MLRSDTWKSAQYVTGSTTWAAYIILCKVGIMHVLHCNQPKDRVSFRGCIPYTNASSHSLPFCLEMSCITSATHRYKAGRTPYLGDLSPGIPSIPHNLQPLLFRRTPRCICPALFGGGSWRSFFSSFFSLSLQTSWVGKTCRNR